MFYQNYKYNFEPISKFLTDFERSLYYLEQIRYIENPNEFFKETAYLKKVDSKLSYYYLFSKIKSNNFNRGSGYLTHGFDFYRGSFHGQMIRGLINYCNLNQKDIILDPFCGCGTTLIEAKLLGFNSIGIDINPIACLNSIIKTKLLDISLESLTTNNEKYFSPSYFKNLIPFTNNFNEFLNSNIKELFYFFLFTRAIALEKRLNLGKRIGFKRTYNKIINTLSKFEDLKNRIRIKFGKVNIYFQDSISYLYQFKSHSIDLIITSPPYFDLIDYIEEDINQIKFLFQRKKIFELKSKSIGYQLKNWTQTNRSYWFKINIILKELYRILKPNKKFILIIGNYKNMLELFINHIKTNGFFIERILPREVYNIKKKNNIEYVLFLRK